MLNDAQEYEARVSAFKNATESSRLQLEAALNFQEPNLDELREANVAKHGAILQTAKSVEKINNQVTWLNTELDKERKERKVADKKAFWISISCALFALGSLIIAIAAYFR